MLTRATIFYNFELKLDSVTFVAGFFYVLNTLSYDGANKTKSQTRNGLAHNI